LATSVLGKKRNLLTLNGMSVLPSQERTSPASGHVLNLEEPALFNEAVERFLALVEANRWGARDPRSVAV
jgi:hypothetical protein